MKAAISIMLLTAIFVPNALCSSSESDFEFISRTSNRLGYGVFYDHWSFDAGYKSGNDEIHMSQSGELSGSLNGCSLQLYEIGEERYPAFYEFSVRTGVLEGLVSTLGDSADYLADSSTDRKEVEGKIGTRVRSGGIDVNMSMGGVFIHSSTIQVPRTQSSETSTTTFSTDTHLGSIGLDLVCDRDGMPFSYGIRWDNSLLLGLFDPDFEDPSLVWGYDSRISIFASYQVELNRCDLSFMIKGGGMIRDYFGLGTQHFDVSEIRGLYFRAGVGFSF